MYFANLVVKNVILSNLLILANLIPVESQILMAFFTAVPR